MLSFLTDDTHNDLYLDTRGNLASASGAAAVGQVCRNVLRLNLGELPLNIPAGIPYLEDIFAANASLGVAQAYMTQAIGKVSGVKKILSFNLERRGDTLTYRARILTNQGEVEING